MKWEAGSKYSRSMRKWRRSKLVEEWHTKFAWLPVVIDEVNLEGVVCPRHWLWLERYERCWMYVHSECESRWKRRPYTGARTLRQLVLSGDPV
jgi:hypothetical protein